MSFLRTFSRYLEKFEGLLITLALLFMVTLAFLQVLLRNFWDTGLSWGDPVVRTLVLWIGFLGASIATHRRSHIRFDVISKFLPERGRRIAESFVRAISAVICVLLANAAWQFVMSEKEFGSMLVDHVPSWIALLIIPISFVVIAFRMAFLSLEDFILLLSKKEES